MDTKQMLARDMLKEVTTKGELLSLTDNSAFTIEGAGGNLLEWCVGLNEMLGNENIGQVKTFYTFKGKLMNETYGLTGDNAYKDDLTFLCFMLDGLDIGKLAMFKMRFGARWLDDIVDNNQAREETCSTVC